MGGGGVEGFSSVAYSVDKHVISNLDYGCIDIKNSFSDIEGSLFRFIDVDIIEGDTSDEYD